MAGTVTSCASCRKFPECLGLVVPLVTATPLCDGFEIEISDADTAVGCCAGDALADFDEELTTDMPAFLAAASKGAGIAFAAAALGAVAEDVAKCECSVSTCNTGARETTADFAALPCCLEDGGGAEDPVSSNSFASRNASASFFFFFEAGAEEDEEDDALGAWDTEAAETAETALGRG